MSFFGEILRFVGDYDRDALAGITGDQARADARTDLAILDAELMCYLPRSLKDAAEIYLERQ